MDIDDSGSKGTIYLVQFAYLIGFHLVLSELAVEYLYSSFQACRLSTVSYL